MASGIREIAGQLLSDIAGLDRRVLFALVYSAVGLTCIAYLKSPVYLSALTAGTNLAEVGREAVSSGSSNLYALVWWVFVSVFFYFAIPAFFVKFVQKRRLSDVGLSLSVEDGSLKLLGLCVAVMLPLVYAMSLTASFASKYPFLRIYNGEAYMSSTLVIWELVYFLQFFGLEFFFRGFLIHSLKPTLGIYSILIMTLPYTMIHFQKPMPETFAAIFAGIFLGWISYRNGTIWLGLILHCAVAFSMDILALYAKGLLF